MNHHRSDEFWLGQWVVAVCFMCLLLAQGPPVQAAGTEQRAASSHLHRAKVYLTAGDYRRALEACQRYVDERPSVEGYVYIAYVLQAMDGYLDDLAKRDEWVKVGQLSLNLTTRNTMDIADPRDPLTRMARELIHEGIRQQFDMTAAMANRLDKAKTDQLWAQQTAWRNVHPHHWWAGVPDVWGW